jgi:hypothetical protein
MKGISESNPNIFSDYKVSLLLGSSLDPSFYSNFEAYRENNSHPHKIDRQAVIYEGYIFSLCTQDNHLTWLGRAENLAKAELAEHFAQQFLLELGYYDE